MSRRSSPIILGLGARSVVPRLAVAVDVRTLPLNSAQGYVVSRIDGRTTLGEICLLCPFSEDETAEILRDLVSAGLVEIPGVSSSGVYSQGRGRGMRQHPDTLRDIPGTRRGEAGRADTVPRRSFTPPVTGSRPTRFDAPPAASLPARRSGPPPSTPSLSGAAARASEHLPPSERYPPPGAAAPSSPRAADGPSLSPGAAAHYSSPASPHLPRSTSPPLAAAGGHPATAGPPPPSAAGGHAAPPVAPAPPSPHAGTGAAPSVVPEDGIELSPELRRRIDDALASISARDPALLLGVPKDCDKGEVRRAYFRLAKEFHPDRYFGKQLGPYRARLESLFAALTDAYNHLLGR